MLMDDRASDDTPQIEKARDDVTRLRILTWRAKAEELRTVADGMKNESARRGMLTAAANYERLADEAEERGKPGASRSRPETG
jgi:hypothetical protein